VRRSEESLGLHHAHLPAQKQLRKLQFGIHRVHQTLGEVVEAGCQLRIPAMDELLLVSLPQQQ